MAALPPKLASPTPMDQDEGPFGSILSEMDQYRAAQHKEKAKAVRKSASPKTPRAGTDQEQMVIPCPTFPCDCLQPPHTVYICSSRYKTVCTPLRHFVTKKLRKLAQVKVVCRSM